MVIIPTYDGSVEDRFERDWESRGDDVKHRSFDQRSEERKSREYVDPETGVSASGATSDIADELWDKSHS